MKRLLLISLLIAACCGCDKEDASAGREETVTVASKRIYFNDPVGPSVLFYLVRFEEGTQPWKPIRTIRNFAYETGYEYRIRMRITEYEPEPGVAVDSDPTLYECLEVVSRERKTSSGLPDGAVDE